MEILLAGIGVTAEEFSRRLDDSLRVLGEATGAGRVFVFRYDFERDLAQQTHEWHADSIASQFDKRQALPLEEIRASVETNRSGKPYIVDDVARLDDERMRSVFQSQGLKSVLTLPIIAAGECTGCVGFDFVGEGRRFSDREVALLTVFAQMIAVIQQHIVHEQDSHAEARRYHMLFDSMTDAILVVDEQRRITDCNSAFTELFGYSREEVLGEPTSLLFASPEDFQALGSAMKNHREGSGFFYEVKYRRKSGDTFFGEKRLRHITDEKGAPDGFIATMRDITERKEAEKRINDLLQEKEILLHEVHHRVKNNMSSIASLLSLQADRTPDSAASQALSEARNRLQSMEVLYDKLYRSENIRNVSTEAYLPALVEEIVRVFPSGARVSVDVRIEGFFLEVKTISTLGMIVNELVTNAMKYAFSHRDEGVLTISASRRMVDSPSGSQAIARITIADNGRGLPESVDFRTSEGFGFSLVDALVDQLNGTITIERGNGTKFFLEFPV